MNKALKNWPPYLEPFPSVTPYWYSTLLANRPSLFNTYMSLFHFLLLPCFYTLKLLLFPSRKLILGSTGVHFFPVVYTFSHFEVSFAHFFLFLAQAGFHCWLSQLGLSGDGIRSMYHQTQLILDISYPHLSPLPSLKYTELLQYYGEISSVLQEHILSQN